MRSLTSHARSFALLACAGAAAAAGCSGQRALPAPHEVVLETGVIPIDRIYHSMSGPSDRIPVDYSDLDWVTAYRTRVIDAGSREPMGDEFFCHSQLQMQNGTRLMVTATGSAEISFPKGFGMRVSQIMDHLDGQQRLLSFFGMVLNNHVPVIDRRAKVQATIQYFKDQEVGDPPLLKKLYKAGLTMEVENLKEYQPAADQPAHDDVSTHCALVTPGRNSHWWVPPGKQTTRKRYSDFLPVDATVHYAVVHLHNYARYFRLTDATTGQILWQTDVEYEPHRVQITRIPVYSSKEGFRVYKDHTYEIEALYENTTDKDVDAMAQIDLYYHPDGDVAISYPTGPR